MALSAPILASVNDDAIQVRWWIEIEGLRVRYGTWTPSWTPADTGTNRPVKPWLKVPSVGSQKSEPMNGNTKGHAIDVELLDVGDALTALFAVHNRSGLKTTDLAADITDAGLSLTVADSSVFSLPCDIYVDRETMRATAAPDGTHLTVTRGMYGSTAVEHLTHYPNSLTTRECEVVDKPQFIHTRRLTLHEGRYDLVEADCFTFGGYIDGLEERDGLWSLSASGNLTRLKAKIGETRAHGTMIYQLVGEYFRVTPGGYLTGEIMTQWDNPDSEFYKSRGYSMFLAGGIETTFPTASATQRRLVKIDSELIAYEDIDLTSGALVMIDGESAAADYGPLSAQREPFGRGMFCDLIFPFDQDWSWHERAYHGEGTGLWNNIMIEPHAAGSAVEHCLWHEDFTAGTDPVSVFLQIMISGNGSGGTYDTLPDGWGLGIPTAEIDVAGLEDLKSAVSGIDLKFAIVEPVEAMKWLKENVLRPAMLFPVEKLDGTISLCRMWDRQEAEARGATVTIDHSVMLSGTMPRLAMPNPPVGELRIKINHDPGADEFWSEVKVTFGETAERYKSATQTVELECKSAYAPGALGSLLCNSADMGNVPAMLSGYIGAIFDRFALQPLPTISCEVPYNIWPLVQNGSIVKFTSTVIPNVKTGTRAITNEWCQVLEVKPNIRKSCLQITLAYIGVHDAETRRIAPSLKVKSYASDVGAPARTKIEVYRHIFTGSLGTRGDTDEFAAGDMIRFYNAECEPLHATDESALEIDEVDTSGGTYDVIWLVAAELDNPPGDGDYIEIADYDQCVARQQARFAFQCDANGLLGAGNDNADVRG